MGQVIGNYRIVSELGRGGMGMVYRAEHVQLGRPAALKMLLPQMSNDPSIVQRFFNEARAASAIDHPGIVEVYEFGTHVDGRAYFVMALLKGETLAQRLERGGMTATEGATIAAQVVGALAAAHARGIIHRDLKPDNIFLVPNDEMPGGIQTKLLDFGIAKLADEQAGFKTQTGALIGTPAYMSPEQCMGRPDLDHRTDLYSMGCILFHVLCGRPPFVSDHGTGVLIAAHIRDLAPDPRSVNPQLTEPLAAIVRRLLQKEPAARFQSAAELRSALIAAGANAPITRLPASAEAYAATMAPTSPSPTTRSGSAAQIVGPTTPGRKAGKLGVWIGVGVLLFALAGTGVFVAMRGGGAEPTSAPTASSPPPAAPTPRPAASPAAVVTPIAVTTEPTCESGQARSDDTRGHCCWPGQAWSTSKARCVGTPSCPRGTKARGEQCAAVAPEIASTQAPRPPDVHDPATTRVTAPTLSLSAKTYAPGATIEIHFASAISSTSTSRAWVTVTKTGTPATSYGTWKYVDDGATGATLVAPAPPGAYEVRLHTNYPKQAFNVQRTAELVIADTTVAPVTPAVVDPGATPLANQRFSVAKPKLHGGDAIEVTFPTAMHAEPRERFWITVVAQGAGDDTYGKWDYVADGARHLEIAAPTVAGDYEVRLHANYPKKSTNVVFRVRIRVEPT